MRIALAQIDTVVGDLSGNLDLVLAEVASAREAGADLVVFPELALVGYPPRDLVERPGLARAADDALARLRAQLGADDPHVLVGSIDWPDGLHLPRNVAHLLAPDGAVHTVAKRLLPTYDVFDEVRHFAPGPTDQRACFRIGDVTIGVLVCEDQWTDPRLWKGHRPYPVIPARELREAGASLVVNLSASPFSAGKLGVRAKLAMDTAEQEGVAVALCNLVGGNDSLVFDGGSLLVNGGGALAGVAPRFEASLLVADFDASTRRFAPRAPEAVSKAAALACTADWPEEPPMHIRVAPAELDDIEDALVLGLRGYANKLGFESMLLGLSGGIDSALVAYLAARAFGGRRVHVVEMPSRYTAKLSRDISRDLIASLDLQPEVIDIEPLQSAFLSSLAPHFGDRPPGVTEENLQSRIRGTLLMALSNKRGHLLLTTGNKSEMAVGYCTLYGDMNGGLSVISDLFKLQIRALCERVNARAGREIIPRAVIERPPSAELREDQRDEDSLPPYEQLDPALHGILVDRLEDAEIAEALGMSLPQVQRIRKLTNRAEFKRFQAAPTLRVSPKAWHGRRYPIVHRFGSFDAG